MAKKKLNKKTRQLALLGGLVAVIVGVLIYIVGGGPAVDLGTSYRGRTVDTDIDTDVFEHPTFRTLESPVSLPLVIGAKGRDNPFEPIAGSTGESQ